MTALDIKTPAVTNKLADCEDCTSASANGRRDRGANDAELRKRTKSEDQTGAEQDVDPVREPQRAHRDRSIAGATKDRVDHEEHHDADVAGEHHSCEC